MRHVADRLLDLVDRARHDEPEQDGDQADEHDVVERRSRRARGMPRCASASTAGRIAAASMKARKRSAASSFSFQSASAGDDDAADDERGDGGSLGGLLHFAKSSPAATR